jgi:hypothetical protein
VISVCILSVGFFFRHQIYNKFTILSGDTYDSFIVIAILEHWYNVVRGLSHWSQTNYFYPDGASLGYNDGYLIYGLIYSIFRRDGFDPFISYELVNAAIRLIGFPAFYIAARRIFEFSWGWAVLGAVLFTITNNMALHVLHAQLLSVSFVPGLAVLLHGTMRALNAGRTRDLLIWGSAFNIAFAGCLMTAFYMAWYFVVFSCLTLLLWPLVGEWKSVKNFVVRLRRQAIVVAVLLCMAVAINVPFFALYLPKAAETGMHPFAEVIQYSPSVLDVVGVGDTNLLYGRLQRAIDDYFRPYAPSFSERTTGFPPLLLFLFATGTVSLWTMENERIPAAMPTWRALAAATIVTWLFTLHIGPYSLYRFVYLYIPGARAARVIARYQIFLTVPVIAFAVYYLSTHAHRVTGPLLAALCVLLIAEEVNLSHSGALDRKQAVARMGAIPAPPPGCRVFYVSQSRPGPSSGQDPLGIVGPNIDAMLIAELKNLPTVNGSSSFMPSGWELINPETPAYHAFVMSYASGKGVHGMCELNLKTMEWEGPSS